MTAVKLPQESVLLHHPALLVGAAIKLKLQEVSGALVQERLCALEPWTGRDLQLRQA